MDDARLLESARRRYAPFLSRGKPDLILSVALSERRLRAERSEPLLNGGRLERHDLELGARGEARIVRGLSPLDSLLRIALSFELVKRGGFL